MSERQAESYRRTKRGPRMYRAAKSCAARQAIGDIEHGMELYVLTFGQFSLIDAIVHLVEQTGPADVDVSVWTAAHADMSRASALLEQSKVRRMRWLVDRSFEGRQPSFTRRMRELFGAASIRVTASHCKFVVIRNEEWNLCVRTSMNLNQNPRLENLEISDDAEFCGWLTGVVDSVFAEAAEGDFRANLTALEGVVGVDPDTGITCADVSESGFVSAKQLRAF